MTFKWYKNGADSFPKHVRDELNGTLHFNGVLEEDKGNYTCVASNSQGQINHTIKIDVVSKFFLFSFFSSASSSLISRKTRSIELEISFSSFFFLFNKPLDVRLFFLVILYSFAQVHH